MLPEAQEMMMNGQLAFDFPLGVILSLTLLALMVSGVAFESGVLGMARAWLTGNAHRVPTGVATAGQRG